MNPGALTAGVARIDVTPPVGFRMQGMMRRIGGSVGVESPLLATALVLADDLEKVVILDCDLFGFDMQLDREMRTAIGERIGVPASHVLLGYTHTHHAPCTVRGTNGGVHDIGGDPVEREALEAYIANLVTQLAGLADLADHERKPAHAAAGRGEVAVAINREERTPDGRIVVGRNPDGIVDHSVEVLRVDDADGKPLAVLTGYAAHPVVMGLDTYVLSPDFPGVVRRVVERVTGATCLYLTGAAGDQATLSFLQDDWGENERMGGMVAAEVAKVFFTIEPRPHEVVREPGKSLSSIAHYHKRFKEKPEHRILQAATREIQVPLQPLPALAVAEARLEEASAAVRELQVAGAPAEETYPLQLVERWAAGVLDKVRDGITQETLTIEIIGIQLDDFLVLGMPGEPFVEIGLRAKGHSRLQHNLFAGFCNGVKAYWPTAETIRQGGMAVESSVITYNISAPPVEESADIIVAEFAQLLEELDLLAEE